MKSLEDQLLHRLEKIDNNVDSINITLAKQEEQIRFHIKRTDLLEDSIKEVSKDLKPVQRHVFYVNGVLKFLGIASLVIGLLKSFKII